MESLLASQYTNLPKKPGVYLLKGDSGSILYVGKAKSLRSRLASYFASHVSLGRKTNQLVRQTQTIGFITVESEFDALLLEAKLIKKYLPRWNSAAKDDKHFIYIRISGDEFPKLTTSRREDDPPAGKQEKKSTYFGPFPSSGTVRAVLKLVRRVFPYCGSPKIGRRACFYSHLGLCHPCPAEIVKQDPGPREVLKETYRQNIRRIHDLLSGRSRQLISLLEKEMTELAGEEKFEEAALIRDQIEKVRYITAPRAQIMAYLEKPDLLGERRQEEGRDLARILRGYGIEIGTPERIEGYDISDIKGKLATGAMVVFEGGEPEKSAYRRFRIRSRETADDVAMIKEVVARRLKHLEWELPDLIVVDGGKGQVKAAISALQLNKVILPVIGLAKREEEIYLLVKDGFKKIRLSPDAAALRLIQRLRDEAHRFARSYHLNLRSKYIRAGQRFSRQLKLKK